MQTLNQGIKDRISKPVYLLFGEEASLKKSYKGRLREALIGGDTMSYNYFRGKEVDVNKIIGLTDTISLFVGKCLILIEDSGFFKGGAGAGELTEYTGGIPESTCLIFVGSEVDRKSRLYKAVEKYGYTAKSSHQEPTQLTRRAAGILSKNSRKITGRAVEFLLSKTGNGMENISSELEKLMSYTLGRETIIDEGVETICTTQIINKIFDMVTAIAARQTRKAMNLCGDLLTLKEPPMRVLFLITRQFSQVFRVRGPVGRGMDESTIASRLKLQPFVAGKIMLQARTSTKEQILSYVDLCVDAEEGAKIRKLQDRLAVELPIADEYE